MLATRVVHRKARSPNRRRRASDAVGPAALASIVAIDAGYPVELVGDTAVPFTVIFDSSPSALFAKSLGSGE